MRRASFALATLVGYATAECPNACSGHGTCGAKDSCSCYPNYQSNDCSERTCYFGLAHVDSPKGDLNADGLVSGPLTTVITGSEVYPWGTTEQFPNANSNEGHFYMECSNKGICDRKTGTCDCFDGYTGTACARAACPNDCSGHGTCESIKELAEMRSFDTTAHDVPSTRVSGSDNHHNFNSAIEESYSYDLWDQDKTMGCKCDPVYYGADCSLKKCKYGVDPLFYDEVDGRIHQTSVIHIGTKDRKGAVGGTFNIVFYDVFGEKYTTKAIDATASTTSSLKVQTALEALPNGVIARTHTDVTFEAGAGAVADQTKTSAVQVSMQKENGAITKSGTIGSGAEGGTPGTTNADGGVGMGTWGGGAGTSDTLGYGPEFTITFSTNPGVLKTIELDTRQVTNPGKTDYWVANARQGQFSSRYSTKVGRVNTLRYGSKLLYTSIDHRTNVPVNTLVKVGGQETMFTAVQTYMVSLHDPFLGTSVIPILTDTKITGTGFSRQAAASGVDTFTFTTGGAGKVTAATIPDLANGAKLYANGCPFQSLGTKYDGTALADDAADLKAVAGNDCPTDAFSPAALVLYRRSDDPTNQNFYKTSGDLAIASNVAACATRGSVDVYTCAATPT